MKNGTSKLKLLLLTSVSYPISNSSTSILASRDESSLKAAVRIALIFIAGVFNIDGLLPSEDREQLAGVVRLSMFVCSLRLIANIFAKGGVSFLKIRKHSANMVTKAPTPAAIQTRPFRSTHTGNIKETKRSFFSNACIDLGCFWMLVCLPYETTKLTSEKFNDIRHSDNRSQERL